MGRAYNLHRALFPESTLSAAFVVNFVETPLFLQNSIKFATKAADKEPEMEVLET